MYPSSFIVEAYTSSPMLLLTAKLSPVIEAWLTEVVPSTIIPSTGILSPGLTTTTSPIVISVTAFSCS